MTLIAYFRKNTVFSISAIAVALAAAFYVGASVMPVRYEANFSITVDQRELQTPTEYAYDGYYALRAAEVFTDTVVSWFKTPSVLQEMRQEAAGNGAGTLPEDLGFRVKKFSGQNIVVTLTDTDRARAEALSDAAIDVVTAHTTEMNLRGDGDSLFVLRASEPIVSERRFPSARAGLIGLALGLALGAVAAFLVTPPRQEEKTTP